VIGNVLIAFKFLFILYEMAVYNQMIKFTYKHFHHAELLAKLLTVYSFVPYFHCTVIPSVSEYFLGHAS